MKHGLVVGITGASGVRYGISLLRKCDILGKHYSSINVVYTDQAVKVASYEEGINLESELSTIECIGKVFNENDWSSPLASSSGLVGFDAVVIPASLNTVSKLVTGIQDNLLLRAVSSIMRLHGRVVLVVRETPLSTIDLLNLYKLSRTGVVVLPASPAFYIKPRSVDDLVDFIVGKVFDALGIEHDLYKRWSGFNK